MTRWCLRHRRLRFRASCRSSMHYARFVEADQCPHFGALRVLARANLALMGRDGHLPVLFETPLSLELRPPETISASDARRTDATMFRCPEVLAVSHPVRRDRDVPTKGRPCSRPGPPVWRAVRRGPTITPMRKYLVILTARLQRVLTGTSRPTHPPQPGGPPTAAPLPLPRGHISPTTPPTTTHGPDP